MGRLAQFPFFPCASEECVAELASCQFVWVMDEVGVGGVVPSQAVVSTIKLPFLS